MADVGVLARAKQYTDEAFSRHGFDAKTEMRFVPPGAVLDYFGHTAPEGYLFCDGSSYRCIEYPELFDAIGYMYSNTNADDYDFNYFNVPDLRGYVAVGCNNSGSGVGAVNFNVVGKKVGSETHTLTVAEMPSHKHAQSLSDNGTLSANAYQWVWSTTARNFDLGNDLAQLTGGDQPHNNIQPSVVCYKIISVGVTANILSVKFGVQRYNGHAVYYVPDEYIGPEFIMNSYGHLVAMTDYGHALPEISINKNGHVEVSL